MEYMKFDADSYLEFKDIYRSVFSETAEGNLLKRITRAAQPLLAEHNIPPEMRLQTVGDAYSTYLEELAAEFAAGIANGGKRNKTFNATIKPVKGLVSLLKEEKPIDTHPFYATLSEYVAITDEEMGFVDEL